MKNLYYIAIEGPIGVGKTSLAKLISERLHARLVLEEFDRNPFLEEFYDDPRRFAFQTQLFFLLSRFKQQQELLQVDLFHKLLATDYMFQKDRLFAYLNLNEKELALYDQIAKHLEPQVMKPDLVIYLQAETGRLMRNIKNRGRKFEVSISREYIESLNQVYNQFFMRYNETPLMIVNVTDIDFVNNSEDLEDLMDNIRKPFTGTKFYNPAKSLL
ncbi:deoxynucleoside kinase [bacterium]|nr:deoxynucleoside kinase [bacterium]MBL7052465.1 deoxynucleoside kinase [Candidatus Neomarinimicrobiota bacterium]